MPKNSKLVGWGMSMVFAPTWLPQVSPLLHMTTLTTAPLCTNDDKDRKIDRNSSHSLRLFSRENAIPVVHII